MAWGYARKFEKLRFARLTARRLALPSGSCADSWLAPGTDAVTANVLVKRTPRIAYRAKPTKPPTAPGLGVHSTNTTSRGYTSKPIAARQDADFATEAHELTGTTFVAHVQARDDRVARHRNTTILQDGGFSHRQMGG